MAMLTCPACGRESAPDAAFCAGCGVARILLDQGRNDEAALVVQALDDRFGPAYRFSRAPGRSIGGVLAARRGDPVEALRRSDEAIALTRPMDFVMLQADVGLDRAEIDLLAGRLDEARLAADAALEQFTQKGYAIGIRRAEAFRARLTG